MCTCIMNQKQISDFYLRKHTVYGKFIVILTKRTSKEEALKDYEDTLDEAVEQFGEFGVNEEALEEFRQFSIDLYKAVKYEVKEALLPLLPPHSFLLLPQIFP